MVQRRILSTCMSVALSGPSLSILAARSTALLNAVLNCALHKFPRCSHNGGTIPLITVQTVHQAKSSRYQATKTSIIQSRAAHLAPSGPNAGARPAWASLDRAPSPATAKGLLTKLSEPSTVGRAAGSVTTTKFLPNTEYLWHTDSL